MKVLLHIKPNLQQISHKDIQNVESRLKFSIPDSLKELLLHYNGGYLGVNVFYTKFDDGDQRLYELYHLNSLEEIESAWGYVYDDPEIQENQILPFGETLGSPCICIGIGHKNYGKIFLIDWDFGVAFQANTLQEFLGQLKYDKKWRELPPFKNWE